MSEDILLQILPDPQFWTALVAVLSCHSYELCLCTFQEALKKAIPGLPAPLCAHLRAMQAILVRMIDWNWNLLLQWQERKGSAPTLNDPSSEGGHLVALSMAACFPRHLLALDSP